MKQRLLIAIFTALVFGAGYAARMWTEGVTAAVPPPPASLGSEFQPVAPPVAKGSQRAPAPKADHDSKPDRVKLIADIGKMRSQIDTYHARLDELDGEFDRQFVQLLTPAQQERFASRQKRMEEGRARSAADPTPLSDEQILQLQQFPLYGVLWSVAVNARVERLTRDYKLTEEQVPKVRELLLVHREKFLALVDLTPPPSIRLSELARSTQKLGEPAKARK